MGLSGIPKNVKAIKFVGNMYQFSTRFIKNFKIFVLNTQ